METKTIIWAALSIILATSAHAQGSALADGGNVTPVNLQTSSTTQRWQGFAGTIQFISPNAPSNVTAQGGEVNGTQFNITAACNVPTSVSGFILFSNSSTTPAGLTAGNLSQLDAFVAGDSDSGSNTFNSTSTFNIGGNIPSVPTTFTYVNSQAQTTRFREGYLNDASGNLVFAVAVDLDLAGYNGSSFDFQAILPTDNTTDTLFFVTTDLDIVCPTGRQPSGGGAGPPGGAQCIWLCDSWSACQNGTQARSCNLLSPCHTIVYPPLVRLCADEPRKAVTIRDADLIQEVEEARIDIDAPREIDATAGNPLTIPFRITNPNAQSIENVSVVLTMPTIRRAIRPLHTSPFAYLFGTRPLGLSTKPATWPLPSIPTKRLLPTSTTTFTIHTRTPLLTPQTITGTIDIYSGGIILESRPINIKVSVPPLALMHHKQERLTDVEILVDNRGNSGRVPLELMFNRRQSSLFTDYYAPRVSDDVVIFGHTFGRDYDYDTARIRSNRIIVEAP